MNDLQKAYCEKLALSLQALSDKPDLTLLDFAKWITRNLNEASVNLSGYPGSAVGKPCSCGQYEVVAIDGVPLIVAHMSWALADKNNVVPDITGLTDVLHGVALTITERDDLLFCADVTFALTQWSNLLPFVIDDLLWKCLSEDCGQEERRASLSSLIVVRDNYYPNIDLNKLALAVELGVTHNGEESLREWFDGAGVSSLDLSISPPCDFQ